MLSILYTIGVTRLLCFRYVEVREPEYLFFQTVLILCFFSKGFSKIWAIENNTQCIKLEFYLFLLFHGNFPKIKIWKSKWQIWCSFNHYSPFSCTCIHISYIVELVSFWGIYLQLQGSYLMALATDYHREVWNKYSFYSSWHFHVKLLCWKFGSINIHTQWISPDVFS